MRATLPEKEPGNLWTGCIVLALLFLVSISVMVPALADSTVTVSGVIISMPAPVAQFSGTPLSGPAPLTVQFTDQSTNTPTSWKWEYKKGSGSWTQFSTSQNPSYTFTATGIYSIRLTATNAVGSNTLTKTSYITINNVPAPLAAFTATPTTGYVPLAVQFTDQSTNTPTSWKWEHRKVGSGSWIQFSTEQNPSNTFSTKGTYSIRLTSTNAGGSSTKTMTDYITAKPYPKPVAGFTQDKYFGKAPLTIRFTDQSQNGPVDYLWSFGDGTTTGDANPVHIYTNQGLYRVRLTVSNEFGSSSAQSYVYVIRNYSWWRF